LGCGTTRQAESATFFSFLMFVGVAVSITAFPVLARILTDQNLMQTRVGLIALSSAAVDDVVYSPSPSVRVVSCRVSCD
jgi:Kef-type K+ transport system membrane component KefB